MSEQDWFGELIDGAPSQRAHAAFSLLDDPYSITSSQLTIALQKESVPQIRKVLDRVILKRKALSPIDDSHRSQSSSASLESGRFDAGEIASVVRHELSPPVGWIHLAAVDSVSEYENSELQRAIVRLERRIDGVVAFFRSHDTLQTSSIDLKEALVEAWPSNVPMPDVLCDEEVGGVSLITDLPLLSILLSNVLRNAVDASIATCGEARITIEWGKSDRSFWLRVTNPFDGDHLNIGDVRDPGSTSKIRHQGRGMALITSISARLGFESELEGVNGSATFRLRGKING